jgi:DNA-directed RNA polymerase sigma subunit (sigma70/sigma32)
MILKMKSAAATATAATQVRSMTEPSPMVIKKGSRKRVTPMKPMGASLSLHAVPDAPAPAAVAPAETAAVRTSKKDKLASMQQAERLERRDRVVLEHLPLVKAIAVRVHENLPVHVDLDDLVHAGILGLFDAASKYNPDKQVAFSSYAKHRIKGAILDSLRQLDWAATSRWKRPRASSPLPCSAIQPKPRWRKSWAWTRSAGAA